MHLLIALLHEVISEGINNPLHQNSMKTVVISFDILFDTDIKWSKELNHIESLEEYLNNLSTDHDLNNDNQINEYDYELYLNSRVHA